MASNMKYLGMPAKSQKDWIEQLQHSGYLNDPIDSYNKGKLISELEERVADLLDKPKALFFSKGMTAQFCALKTVTELSQNSAVGVHPLSHIAYDEQNSIKHLLQLEPLLIGKNAHNVTLDDLKSIKHKPAAVVLELPLRRAGFKLPTDKELQQMLEWCRQENIHRHMDGARLWESAPYYEKTAAAVAKNFDSVYVSLYKGLGAMGGAILAGEVDFIQQCKIWRTRFAGDHYTIFPYVVSALDGLERHLSDFPESFARAKEIAEILKRFANLQVAEPQTNGFHVLLDRALSQKQLAHLNQQAIDVSKQMGICLFRSITPCPYSDYPMIEVQVGPQHQQISNQDVVDYFDQLFA